MPLPIYRMTKAKDVRAKPATSHNSQAGGSANGWGDLKADKGTRFSDLLEPIHAHSFHDAIISLFPAPHIRLLLICNPRPHRPLHDSLQTSDGKLKKPHFLWYGSCNIMFFFHSLFCLLWVEVVWWHSPSKCNLVGSWFHLREGVACLHFTGIVLTPFQAVDTLTKWKLISWTLVLQHGNFINLNRKSAIFF